MPISEVVYLVGSQFVTKFVTFASNQLVLRMVSPTTFGVAAYLEFLVSSTLFFCREAERIANQRAKASSDADTISIIENFAYLPLFLFVPVAGVLHLLQTYSELYRDNISKLPNVHYIFSILASSVILELIAEPLFAVNQHRLNFRRRSKIESVAVLCKCFATFAGVSCLSSSEGSVLAFALGQLAYSTSIFAGYWVKSSGIPRLKIFERSYGLDEQVLSIWKSLFVQMIFKHLLTEGDTLLISYLFTANEQGIYSVVANYGSIIARLLFQPMEEFLRASTAKCFSSEKIDYAGAFDLMNKLIIFYINLTLLIVLGGYCNGSFMLHAVFSKSEKWLNSTVFSTFPIYVLYIPFLAFNGIMEAFFSSASTKAQISKFSVFMSISSASICILLYFLISKLHLGITGLILANMVNMTLRFAYCSIFFVRFFANKTATNVRAFFKRILPPILLTACAYVLHRFLFQDGMTKSPIEFIQSVFICVACLLGMLLNEKEQLLDGIRRQKVFKND